MSFGPASPDAGVELLRQLFLQCIYIKIFLAYSLFFFNYLLDLTAVLHDFKAYSEMTYYKRNSPKPQNSSFALNFGVFSDCDTIIWRIVRYAEKSRYPQREILTNQNLHYGYRYHPKLTAGTLNLRLL